MESLESFLYAILIAGELSVAVFAVLSVVCIIIDNKKSYAAYNLGYSIVT
jgi:hypothetical protein